MLATYLGLSSSAVFASQCIDLDKLSLTNTEKQQTKDKICNEIRCDPHLSAALYQMTYDTIQVLDHHQIPYNVMFGTLLGTARNQGMLPHDDDIDLAFLKEDEQKLVGLTSLFDQLGYRLFVDGSDYTILKEGKEVNGPNYVGYKLYAKEKIKLTTGKEVFPFLDLFSFIWDDSSHQYILDTADGRVLFEKAQLKKEWFHDQAEYPFGRMKVKGPKNYEAPLSHFYGKSWDEIVYVSHMHNGTLAKNYMWTITEIDRQPPLTALLQERVKEWLK